MTIKGVKQVVTQLQTAVHDSERVQRATNSLLTALRDECQDLSLAIARGGALT